MATFKVRNEREDEDTKEVWVQSDGEGGFSLMIEDYYVLSVRDGKLVRVTSCDPEAIGFDVDDEDRVVIYDCEFDHDFEEFNFIPLVPKPKPTTKKKVK